MRLPPDEVLRLYDAHAPRLFALALRVHGGDRPAAAATLTEVFADPPSAEPRDLVRAVRERALASRQVQIPRSTVVENGEPSPRRLVEEAFYSGASVSELAQTYQLPESAVRSSLKDGMAALRQQFASGSTKVQQ
jgi:DNA-directed RNA polymerase specialized sigma24 family protein